MPILINPAQEHFGGFLSRYVPVGIPVAIGCLMAYLRKHDIESRVVDEELVDITPQVLRELVEGMPRPYIFGISCLTAHVVRGYEIAAMIKREWPDAVVVTGGLHPTALPEESLATGNIDYVVRGEGEEVFLQMVQMIREGKTPKGLGGVSYLDEDGQVVNNGEAPLIASLDDIPLFPYEAFSHPKYDMGFITTSRGCPYKCTYCSQRLLTGTTYRFKSAQQIVDELTVLIREYDQKHIVFYDDNFCFQRKRVLELCDLIIEAKLHEACVFSIQTRADNFPEDLVARMSEAGFRYASFGMETGSNRLARLIEKGETVERHLEAVKCGNRHGLKVTMNMILGLPTETAEERELSYQTCKRAGVTSTKYNNLIPYPGTPMYEDLKQTDRIHIEPGWSNFNSTLSLTRSIFDRTPLAYVPETCSEFELKRDIVKYNLKTYLTPSVLLNVLKGDRGDIGWYKMPERWYTKPREVYEVSKIGVNVGLNTLISFLPLKVTEPVMNLLNPAMKKRPRIEGYDPSTFRASRWSKESAVAKVLGLKGSMERRRKRLLESERLREQKAAHQIVAGARAAATKDAAAKNGKGRSLPLA